MKNFAAVSLAVASAFSAALAQGNLIISSPAALVQCQPVLVSWSGGTAPYYVSVIPGGQASAAALETFPTTSALTYTWTVDLAAGQDVTFKIVDSTGQINYSSPLPIQAGSDTSCLNGGANSVAATSSSRAAAVTTSSSVRAPLTTSSSSMITSSRTSSSTSAPASSSTSSASVASATPTGGAAGKAVANIVGVAALAGLVAFMA